MLAGLSTVEYIRKAPDPTNTAVFLEDLVAVGGVGEKTALFEPFIYKMHHFTKTGSGQT